MQNLPRGYGVAAEEAPDGGDPMCVCGRRWDDHSASTDCPNKKCMDGEVYVSDDPNDFAQVPCPVCKGTCKIPLADGDDLPPCYKFEERDNSYDYMED
jgi:hypothetical protein